MSWRNKLSWRWIIRGTCLGLLLACAGLWGLSYFLYVGVTYTGSPELSVHLRTGRVLGAWLTPDPRLSPSPRGLSVYGQPAGAGPHRQDADFPRFLLREKWTFGIDRRFDIPLCFPSVLLAIVSWIAWRKTGRRKPGRGFPIEPLASRRENLGG